MSRLSDVHLKDDLVGPAKAQPQLTSSGPHNTCAYTRHFGLVSKVVASLVARSRALWAVSSSCKTWTG